MRSKVRCLLYQPLALVSNDVLPTARSHKIIVVINSINICKCLNKLISKKKSQSFFGVCCPINIILNFVLRAHCFAVLLVNLLFLWKYNFIEQFKLCVRFYKTDYKKKRFLGLFSLLSLLTCADKSANGLFFNLLAVHPCFYIKCQKLKIIMLKNIKKSNAPIPWPTQKLQTHTRIKYGRSWNVQTADLRQQEEEDFIHVALCRILSLPRLKLLSFRLKTAAIIIESTK